MNQLQVIAYQNQRVLTTAQIADSYGAEEKLVQQNFSNNKARYKEGKHFFLLQGEDLRTFKRDFENLGFAPNLNKLYLWTEKGAWLHAKSLNTDAAWDAYEMLVDEYYNIREAIQLMTPSELALLQAQNIVALEKRVHVQEKKIEALEANQENLSKIIELNPVEWRKKVTNILNKIALAMGGFDAYRNIRNESYTVLEERARCKLDIRLANRRKEMALNGASKSKRDKLSKLDVIADDQRLLEIYLAVVKEMAIRYRINIEGLGA